MLSKIADSISICLSLYLSVYVVAYLSVCLCTYFPASLSISLSLSLPLSLLSTPELPSFTFLPLPLSISLPLCFLSNSSEKTDRHDTRGSLTHDVTVFTRTLYVLLQTLNLSLNIPFPVAITPTKKDTP